METLQVANELFMPQVRRLIADGHTVHMPVRGRSMRPFIDEKRDTVILKAIDKPRMYDAVLAENTPDHYVLHRIIAIEGDNITLQGDGNICGVEHCTPADILGVVEYYVYPHGKVHASRLRFLTICWRYLRPIRRYILFLFKLCGR